MAKMGTAQLKKWEATRDIAAEIAGGIKEAKAGVKPHHRVHRFKMSEITAARTKVGLSQERFAAVLGVSRRTLEGWEQGRRKPSGAARSLLIIAARRPEVLREVFAD